MHAEKQLIFIKGPVTYKLAICQFFLWVVGSCLISFIYFDLALFYNAVRRENLRFYEPYDLLFLVLVKFYSQLYYISSIFVKCVTILVLH